jgi:hypothetical protein
MAVFWRKYFIYVWMNDIRSIILALSYGGVLSGNQIPELYLLRYSGVANKKLYTLKYKHNTGYVFKI